MHSDPSNGLFPVLTPHHLFPQVTKWLSPFSPLICDDVCGQWQIYQPHTSEIKIFVTEIKCLEAFPSQGLQKDVWAVFTSPHAAQLSSRLCPLPHQPKVVLTNRLALHLSSLTALPLMAHNANLIHPGCGQCVRGFAVCTS